MPAKGKTQIQTDANGARETAPTVQVNDGPMAPPESKESEENTMSPTKQAVNTPAANGAQPHEETPNQTALHAEAKLLSFFKIYNEQGVEFNMTIREGVTPDLIADHLRTLASLPAIVESVGLSLRPAVTRGQLIQAVAQAGKDAAPPSAPPPAAVQKPAQAAPPASARPAPPSPQAASAPTAQPAPAARQMFEGKPYDGVVEIGKLVITGTKEKPFVEMWGKDPTRQGYYELRAVQRIVKNLLRARYGAWPEMDAALDAIGETYPAVDWTVYWSLSDKVNQHGNPYKNLVDIVVN